jgi:hypothetical protein
MNSEAMFATNCLSWLFWGLERTERTTVPGPCTGHFLVLGFSSLDLTLSNLFCCISGF